MSENAGTKLMERKPEMLALPVRNLTPLEAIATGLRLGVISSENGGVATHGGCGEIRAPTAKSPGWWLVSYWS